MKKYYCGLCKKNTGYINQYGLADSVICKCQGLNEVGVVKNNQYIPHRFDKNAIDEKKPIEPNYDLSEWFV